jgi:hypothetical protein
LPRSLQTHLVDEWIDLEFVAKRTRCIGSLIYYPFVLIALLIVSRSTVFANYAPCLTNLIAAGISLSVVFGCAIVLWWAATAARDTAKQNLTDGIIAARGHSPKVADKSSDATQNDSDDNPRYAEQLETLLSRVDQLKDGAFRPFSQQPLVRALLWPLGSFGCYFNSPEILACEQADITVTLPKPMTSGAKSDGRLGAGDVYRCPAGEKLVYRYTNEEDGKTLRRYWATAC